MAIVPYNDDKPRRKNQPREPIQIQLPSHFKDEVVYWKQHCASLEQKLAETQRDYDELKHLKVIADAFLLDCFKESKKVNLIRCSRNVKQNTCKGCLNRTRLLREIC